MEYFHVFLLFQERKTIIYAPQSDYNELPRRKHSIVHWTQAVLFYKSTKQLRVQYQNTFSTTFNALLITSSMS